MQEDLKWLFNNGIGVAFFIAFLGGLFALMRWALKKDGLLDEATKWFVTSAESMKRTAIASEKQAESMEQHLVRQVDHYKDTGSIKQVSEHTGLCAEQMRHAAILYLRADILRHSGETDDRSKEIVHCLEQARAILEQEV